MNSPAETAFVAALGNEATADVWAELAGADSAAGLCRAWVATLCRACAGARAGLVLLKDPDGGYAPAGVWPEGRDVAYLAEAAQQALMRREGAVRGADDGSAHVAYPLSTGEAPFGAVVLHLDQAGDAAVTAAMRFLHWGAGWLVDLERRRQSQVTGDRLERAAFLVDALLAVGAEPDPGQAGLAAVNRLAKRFACRQVLLGLERDGAIDVAAVSHSAWFDRRSGLIMQAAQAMNEAFDQRARLVWPSREEDGNLVARHLGRYAAESAAPALLAQPMESGNIPVGVWLLERDRAFLDEEMQEVEALSHALGPVLELKKRAHRGVLALAGERLRAVPGRLFDGSHAGAKLLGVAAVLVLVLLALLPAEFRVSARAVVEGAVQRAAVVPFQGYLREAPARAGDIVREGQLLALLDDKDLKLEQVRWESELEVAVRKGNEAMAKVDRVAVRMADAQAGQARAQLDLVREKLARVRVTAPFDGVVVRGDLTQELGSPVEQGKVLFELAPLSAWRIILKVDERDIAFVREGAAGELLLSSLPSEKLEAIVRKVTPVATAEEGRNYFRVEAALPAGMDRLRPGMEGVVKVDAGRRSLLWIWTRRLADWLRLVVWEYTP